MESPSHCPGSTDPDMKKYDVMQPGACCYKLDPKHVGPVIQNYLFTPLEGNKCPQYTHKGVNNLGFAGCQLDTIKLEYAKLWKCNDSTKHCEPSQLCLPADKLCVDGPGNQVWGTPPYGWATCELGSQEVCLASGTEKNQVYKCCGEQNLNIQCCPWDEACKTDGCIIGQSV